MDMPESEPLVRNISDTARWVAVFRAQETERADALFRDPFAARLAGQRGLEIARRMEQALSNPWAFVARTYLFDQVIERSVAAGVDTVVNLAAGLDARPYRLALPNALRWVEVDLPEILSEKEQLLAGETPVCRLERVKLDLSDVAARRRLFARIGSEAKSALVVSEGLLIYLPAEQVAALARDLAAPTSFRRWVLDLASPGLLRMVQRSYQPLLQGTGASLQFGPSEGPPFFEPHGWKPVEVHSLLKTAARHRRLGFPLRLAALLPESTGRQGGRPWSGVCLFERQ
jgi:methyltransferase (TIGR00027 family)